MIKGIICYKTLSLIILCCLTIFSSCKHRSPNYELEKKCETKLSELLNKDTTIAYQGLKVKDFRITEVKSEPLIKGTANTVLANFKVYDQNDREIYLLYVRMGFNMGEFFIPMSTKYAVLVDSILVDGIKIDKDTCCINSVYFINHKATPKRKEIKKSDNSIQPIKLKDYVENLRSDGMTMFHIEGDNVLIFTRWDDPIGGNANSQAEALYKQARAAHVYDIKTVRIMKMPEKKVVGRYVHKKN